MYGEAKARYRAYYSLFPMPKAYQQLLSLDVITVTMTGRIVAFHQLFKFVSVLFYRSFMLLYNLLRY